MIKISKPVLMNEFMVSPVQFTSLNLVSFKNIKPVYDGNEKILLEYEYPSKIEMSPRDWIGLFPRGWNTLQQYVTFEWISQSIPTSCMDQSGLKENGDLVRRAIAFRPEYHINCVNHSAYYQFVYVGKQIEVLGVSSYFRFDLSSANESNLELECLVPVTGKIRSTSVSDFGTISMKNEPSSTSIDSRKLVQTSSIHSLQNLDVDSKLEWSRMNFTDDKKNMCLLKRTAALLNGTEDNLDPYSSHSEPMFPMSLPLSQCKKCYQFKRGGDFMKSQQALQSKLKIVMERNRVLEDRTQEMKKELERLQAESKKMKMSFYNVNKEKIAYEKFVKDFIKSLEKDSIVRVMYGNTEILVKKVNYVGMEEHPRDKKTSKRERELKAVIGLQEITIRNLINSLQEKAKSVEELNQTVKLAQVFSTARTDTREYGIDPEGSADEISNSDLASEYEFSLSKPSPPEEVSADTDEVLDGLRRTSEIALKNIGITRSLGTNSESLLDVTNLSIMTYDTEDAVPKNPRLVDNVDDCWPFPRNISDTLRQKFPEENVNPTKQGNVFDDARNNSKMECSGLEEGDANLSEETEDEKDSDCDASNCEDYYDAYEAFSVRSASPELENVNEESKPSEDATDEEGDEIKVENGDEFLLAAVTPEEEHADGEEKKVAETRMEVRNSCEESAESRPPQREKFNKFTCELSIDFGQKCRSDQLQNGSTLIAKESNCAEQNLVVCRQSKSEAFCDDAHVYSMEQEKSLITFKKSKKCLEIKITQVDQKENPSCSRFHQKMIVQFAGAADADAEKTEEREPTDKEESDKSETLEIAAAPRPEETCRSEPKQLDSSEHTDEESGIMLDRKESDDSNFSNCVADISALQDDGEIENDDGTEAEETDDEERFEDGDDEEDDEEVGVGGGDDDNSKEEEKENDKAEEEKGKEQKEEAKEETKPRTEEEETRENEDETDAAIDDPSQKEPEWKDASEILDGDVPDPGRYPESAISVDDRGADTTPDAQSIKEKMIMQLEEKKTEIAQQFLKSKCNIQMLTEDSISNLKVYQDSLRYEKNLQFLNNKFEEKESEDEALREKPSAIFIQSGQAKVAVIRYQ